MAQPQVIQGSGEELARFLNGLGKRKDLLLIIPAEEPSVEGDEEQVRQILQFGMFPQLLGLTEEDFKSAEWSDATEDLG